ncbi:organic hydroperoxide resistance protein [Saccharopolyspora griseoalba]|uniref:Organic hydroperoxide resistance protein n=1 Tax=Saccharopolyspora griseoalba TaxID=1431848 RepID=A0ABW2LV40_9PSEU
MKTLYTAEATATGGGRDGRTRSSDGVLDLDLAVPEEMGGQGGATNPEQLFAAGYSACFHSALQLVARKSKVDITGSSVTAEVGIGPNDAGGYGLSVELVVEIPDVPREQAQQLADSADQVCPYSNAVRGNVDISVRVA